MSGPAWKRDFPVSWGEDRAVTRRQFTRSLAWVSGASFAATGLLTAKAGSARLPIFPETRVGEVGELAVGESKVFHYPEGGAPCILIRLESDLFVAYGQGCTHLGCPVVHRAGERVLHCPCHEGFFDARNGEVLAGPPPRALPQVALERRGRELWAVGMRP